MSKLKRYIFTGLFILAGVSLHGQQATVHATIQPSDILIGEQAIISIEATAPKGRHIQFPLFQDTLVTGVEVLKVLPPDTVMTEVMKITQKYVVTSFDSTLYHIPSLPVVDGKDTLRTQELGLKVTSPQLSDSTMAYLDMLKNHQTDSLDFEKLGLSDIKDVQDPPFVWTDYLFYILIPIAILLLLGIIGFVVYMILRKRKKGYFFKPTIVLPPHVVALNALEKLKESKKWQKGLEKEYYTELTDILREYIEKRFGINALEMISDDIVEAVLKATGVKSSSDSLAQILKLADLVKFAKYTPFTDETDLSMVNAYLFVNQTKIEEQVLDPNQPAENAANNNSEQVKDANNHNAQKN